MSANAEFEACAEGIAEFLDSFTAEEVNDDPWAAEQVAILDGMLEYAMRMYVMQVHLAASEAIAEAAEQSELDVVRNRLIVPGQE